MINIEFDSKSKHFMRVADRIILKGVRRGLVPAGKEIVKLAKEKAPVRTGRLRESIRSTVMSSQLTIEAAVYYAVFIEYGQKGRPAKPFLGPAVDESQNKIKDIILYHIIREWERV